MSKVASLCLKVNVSNSVGEATAKYDQPPCILRLKVIILLLFHADVVKILFVLMNKTLKNFRNTLFQESQILKP